MSGTGAKATLVAGGTGRLGSILIPLLREDGAPVRALTRSEAAATRLRAQGVDCTVGDIRSSSDTELAAAGCATVISAVSGFGPMGSSTPETVDRDGNLNLIRASAGAGVGHFILISVQGAAADSPLPLMRMKFAAEQELIRSGLPFTIIRPTACLETYLEAIGGPLAKTGSTVVFGSGTVPVNFVSVRDTAALVRRAVQDPGPLGQLIEWGGPNLTLNQLSEALHAGSAGKTRHIPVQALRMISVLARPFAPFLARVARAAVVMNTTDMSFDSGPGRARFPDLPWTGLAEAAAPR